MKQRKFLYDKAKQTYRQQVIGEYTGKLEIKNNDIPLINFPKYPNMHGQYQVRNTRN